eukprot:GHVL01043606.1.p1 GENE.GHVL01043606.1~~GHVL01043606.1.p1  ORF type:complete len:335 (+),score=61.52 GHVL01043606.1:39-1043(+)
MDYQPSSRGLETNQLTEFESEQDLPPRTLLSTDPQAVHNIALFSLKSKSWLRFVPDDQPVTHLLLEQSVVLRDDEEGKEQKLLDELRAKKAVEAEANEDVVENNMGRSQFAFADRAAQTFKCTKTHRGIATEPPETREYCAEVTQWDIYDTYMNDIQAGKEKTLEEVETKANPLYSERMRYVVKVMERVVNQNAEVDVYNDFKYWEDEADAFRESLGTLLPLWRLNDKSIKKTVTSIKWNKRFPEFLAVGFGSYDFNNQGHGGVHCWSLQNTNHPEYCIQTDSGVCCLDWHPTNCALLAVGLYDGTVAVYDIRSRQKRPTTQSSVKTVYINIYL